MRLLLDTNPIILSLNNGYFLSDNTYLISIITELELLSFSGLSHIDEESIRSILNQFEIIGLTNDVKEMAITIRRKYRLKLPDSIIVATAIVERAKLVTADKQLTRIDEVDVVDLIEVIR